MPVVSIKLFSDAADEVTADALIGATTDALATVLGEQVRPYVTVLVEPVPRTHWGSAGHPSPPAVATGSVASPSAA